MKVSSVILAVAAGFLLCGCLMHTVLGGSSDSPDKRYHLWVQSHGAPGKSYVDKSEKQIWIGIKRCEGTNSVELFQQRYTLTGSDIGWHTRWLADDSVSVAFYDWGDGELSPWNPYGTNSIGPSNYIASLSFTFDRDTGKFMEQK